MKKILFEGVIPIKIDELIFKVDNVGILSE